MNYFSNTSDVLQLHFGYGRTNTAISYLADYNYRKIMIIVVYFVFILKASGHQSYLIFALQKTRSPHWEFI